MLVLTHCHEVILMFKAGFCRAPGFSRMSAVQQRLLVWNHLQNECHELWQCVHISWGTQGVPQPLLISWSGALWFSSPWPPQHWKALLLLRGVSLAQHGFGAPHAAGEGNGIILQHSPTCMGVSPQLCADSKLTVLATSAQGSYTEITTAKHICAWLYRDAPLEGIKILEIIHGGVPPRQHLHWGSPRDSTRITKSCETWSKERKIEHLGFNAARLIPSQGTNWDQEIRNWAEHFASAMEHWSGSPINSFLVQFLQMMTFYLSFLKSCIDFTVKHLFSPTSI